jgi:hypothetical protein
VAGQTTVTLNATPVTPSSLTDTQIVFSVPANTATGAIQITTPSGTAVSAGDFVVPTSGIGPIASSLAIVTDGIAQTLSIESANTSAEFTFDGQTDHWVTLAVNTLSTTPASGTVTYNIIAPDNSVLSQGSISTSDVTIPVPPVLLTGTYQIVFNSGANTSVAITANLNSDSTTALAPYAYTSFPVYGYASTHTSVPGQSVRLTFVGTPGEALGFGINPLQLYVADGTAANRRVTLYGPDSSTPLATGSCIAVVGNPTDETCDLNPPILQVSGTYSVVVDIGVVNTSTFAIEAYLTQNSVASAPAGGAAVTDFNPGQNATVTFAGNAGETPDLVLTLLDGISGNFPIGTVIAPDGTQIASFGGSAGSLSNPTLIVPLPALPADGTYSIALDSLAGIYPLGISVDTPYSTGIALTPTGRSIYAATASANQKAALTFSAQAGQYLSFGLSSLAEPSVTMPAATVSVAQPNGSTLSTTSCTLSCAIDLANLPATGTYTVTVTPATSVTMSFVATLSDELLGSLDVSTPFTGSTTRIGQILRIGVNGTPGDAYGLYFQQAVVTGEEGSIQYHTQILNPDGTTATLPSIYSRPQTQALLHLPQAGRYSIVISPGGRSYLPAELDMQLVLNASVPLATNGPTLTWDVTNSGPLGVYTFDGTQGESLGLGITMSIPSVGGNYSTGGQYLIYKPDGSLWVGPSDCVTGTIYFYGGATTTVDGCSIDLSVFSINGDFSLPESGTYTLLFVNDYSLGNTSFDVTLSSWNAAQLAVDGPTVNVSVMNPGQASAVTFNGLSGQTLQLQWRSQYLGTPITVFDPNGKPIAWGALASGYSLDIPTLNQTGTYTVYFVLPDGNTGTLPLNLVTLSSCSQKSGPVASVVSPVLVQPATPTAGQPFTVSATITPAVTVCGQPDGTMTVFGNNGAYWCSYDTASASSCNITASAGQIRFYASFAPTDTTNFQSGTSTANTNVTVAGNSVSVAVASIVPEPSTVGQPYSVQVAVTPVAPATAIPTGTVSVTGSDGANCTFTLPATSCSLTSGNAGPVTVTANYYGDVSYSQTSSPPVTHYVGAVLAPTISGFTPTSGTVGTQVTISGSDLYVSGGPSTVAFNGAAAAVISSSPTQLIATVPSGATSGPVSVTSNGQTARSSTSFNVVSPGTNPVTLAISSASPEPSIVNQSYSVQITVTGTSGTPTGTVLVGDQNSECVVTLPATACTLSGDPTVGEVSLSATYSGDANYQATTVSAEHIVNPATPTEMCGLDPWATPNDPPGFVPVNQLSGIVYTPGIAQDIIGNGNLSVTIASPSPSATVSDTAVDVAGTFVGPTNTGITVNGVVAATVNGQFLASGVPLTAGTNTLTITATTLPGATATTSETVTQGGAPASPISLTIDGQSSPSGFAPATITFDYAIGALPNNASVQSVAIDVNGDGIFDYSAPTLAALPSGFVYSQPGMYTATFKVVDTNNNTYFAYRTVLIKSVGAQRNMLCDVYAYLKDRLNAQDATGATNAYQAMVQGPYASLFTDPGANLPTIASTLGSIANGFIGQGYAEMIVVRDNADQTRNGFPLRMTLGPDGVWRIGEM